MNDTTIYMLTLSTNINIFTRTTWPDKAQASSWSCPFLPLPMLMYLACCLSTQNRRLIKCCLKLLRNLLLLLSRSAEINNKISEHSFAVDDLERKLLEVNNKRKIKKQKQKDDEEGSEHAPRNEAAIANL